MKSTWFNNRVGDTAVAKIFDRYLLNSHILTNGGRVHSWVHKTRLSDHFPIFLKVAKENEKPRAPFKFNLDWALEEYFKQIVLNNWKFVDSSVGISTTYQILQNLQIIKPLVVEWARKILVNRGKKIQEVDIKLEAIFDII